MALTLLIRSHPTVVEGCAAHAWDPVHGVHRTGNVGHMVAAWSVDRLGRSLTGLLELLTELHAKKVDLYLHQQGLDTSTPSGRAMFQMMGVFAEFERAMIRSG